MPVTIRLLDPPLHEFLPQGEEEISALRGGGWASTSSGVETRSPRYHEANPMLGLRGCRLGITFPEITRMQARAIFGAAVEVASEGIAVEPEIMIPLVGDPEELRLQRELVVDDGRGGLRRDGTPRRVPRRHDDRAAARLPAGRRDRRPRRFLQLRHQRPDADDARAQPGRCRHVPAQLHRARYLPDDPFQVLDREGVGQLIEMATQRGRSAKPDLKVSICGEHGGDPSSIAFCHDVGLDYVSCSPFRLPVARLAAAHAALGEVSRDV